jgi:hypothetical protein
VFLFLGFRVAGTRPGFEDTFAVAAHGMLPARIGRAARRRARDPSRRRGARGGALTLDDALALAARRSADVAVARADADTAQGDRTASLVGVLAGGALAIAARELWGIPASIPAWAVIVSLASAGGAGLLFGIYPAARASKLDPVEAMRTE